MISHTGWEVRWTRDGGLLLTMIDYRREIGHLERLLAELTADVARMRDLLTIAQAELQRAPQSEAAQKRAERCVKAFVASCGAERIGMVFLQQMQTVKELKRRPKPDAASADGEAA